MGSSRKADADLTVVHTNRAFAVGHEAFWEALAREDLSEQSRAEIETGLYLLRHFELIYQPRIAGNPDAEYRLKHLVRNVTDKETRQVLSDLLMSMWVGDHVPVPQALVDYGLFLQTRGQWALAHALWDTVLFAWKAEHREQSKPYIEALLNRAMSARYLARYEDALRDYVAAQQLAANEGEFELQLQAMIGGSAAISDNGSPQLALMIIRDAARIARLMGAQHHEVVARLTYGFIYQHAKKPDQALLEFSLAFELAETAEDTDHSLVNIAACAAEYGYWNLACDTNELVAKTSKSPYIRSHALCNLIELYTWQGNEGGFRRTHEALEAMTVDAQVDAFGRLYYLRGLAKFASSSDLVGAYAEGAEAMRRLGVPTAYDAARHDIGLIQAGKPVGLPEIAERPLPLALKRLHQLLQTRLAAAAA